MNSVLKTHTRPTILFDVTDPQHRKWAYDFIKHRTWRDCPVMFALPHSEDNVYSMLMRMMTEYYAEKEFGVAQKPQDATVHKLRRG